MSHYHGCKKEAINLIPHYLTDINRKNVKPTPLEKLQFIQNVIKLMFQVIFIFSDWILIKQIIVSSTPSVLAETDFQKLLPGVLRKERLGACVKMHRFNAFSGDVNIINWKDFSKHDGIFKWEKIEQAFWSRQRDKTLGKLKKYEIMCPWG